MRSAGVWRGISVLCLLAAVGAALGLAYAVRLRFEGERELQALRARLASAEAQAEGLRPQARDRALLQEKLARLEAERGGLRADLVLLQRLLQAAEDPSPLARRLAAAGAELASLRERLRGGESALGRLREEAASLRGGLSGAQAEVALYRALFRAREGEVSELRDRLAAEGRERGSLREQLSGARAELALARGGLAKLKGEMGRLEALQAEREGRARKLAASIEEARRAEEEARRAQTEGLTSLRASYEDRAARLRGEVKQQEIQIRRYRDMLSIRFLDRVLFASGRAELTPAGKRSLDGVLGLLETHPDRMVWVEGHTDDVPISARLAHRYPSNWELSTARAAAVVRYLESKGVFPGRLSAVGFGPYQPVADNATPEGKAQNRRIVILLTGLDLGKLPRER